MIIHYFSDVHFEINGWLSGIDELPGGDLLVMGGDITCARFLGERKTDAVSRSMKKSMAKLVPVLLRYDRVIHIMGNHEHYGFDHTETVAEFAAYYDRRDLHHVLATDMWAENGMVFTTLWSDLDAADPVSRYHIERGMNDYRVIQGMTPEVSTELHRKMKAFTFASKPKMVFSHHAPSFQSETRYRGSTLSPAYCSELSNEILDSGIERWIHGHTHTNTSYEIGQCKVATAMHGYYSERDYGIPFMWGEIITEE